MFKRDDERCIEWRWSMGRSEFFTVQRYEHGHRWAARLSSPRARAFHDVSWTEGAPKVEELTRDWQHTHRGDFRICDWDVYDRQMRKLIGIA